ncbi:MAG: hypothetical protein NVS2B8_05380 [Vulcanimicrobiaceae bacterium]
MIVLHRPNGHPLVVNADLIETAERVDETTAVNLTTGNVLEVVESPEDVRAIVIAYRRAIAYAP